jgi:hypothetical protein
VQVEVEQKSACRFFEPVLLITNQPVGSTMTFAADLLHDGEQAKIRGRDPYDKRLESQPFTWLRGQDVSL